MYYLTGVGYNSELDNFATIQTGENVTLAANMRILIAKNMESPAPEKERFNVENKFTAKKMLFLPNIFRTAINAQKETINANGPINKTRRPHLLQQGKNYVKKFYSTLNLTV